jgi:hypothetical protein
MSDRRKSKVFFSEEKKQKTFGLWRVRSPGQIRQSQKVFWFFFSKKNKLPYLAGAAGLGEAGAGSRGGMGIRCGVGAGRPITKSKDMAVSPARGSSVSVLRSAHKHRCIPGPVKLSRIYETKAGA